jgi:hypothetical protein
MINKITVCAGVMILKWIAEYWNKGMWAGTI